MDIRLSTFLEVLATGNYTRAAENLHITQPAVTKHMRSLEEEFGAVFFRYDGKKMIPTDEARVLENYARSQQKNYRDTLDAFKREKPAPYASASQRPWGNTPMPKNSPHW